MSIRSDELLVDDIIEAIEKINKYIVNLDFNTFLDDLKTQDAVIRNLEIIGEATSKITDKVKNENSDIPWEKMKSLRNRLIHDYSGINLDIVWNIINKDLLELNLKIKKLSF